MKDIKYRGAGTIEMLYENKKFYFIEMNTRIQVEHPVTEMITGIDIVSEQIKASAGKKLTIQQKDIKFRGHAIECRINAENPETFIPSPGTINMYNPPGGLGVRVDSCIYNGYGVVPYYDSLIGKLIVHAENRKEAISRMNRSLNELVVDGIDTTKDLHKKIISSKSFKKYDFSINWLEGFLKK
jgi:Biotin carboxylase